MFWLWCPRRPPQPGRLAKPVLTKETTIMALVYTIGLPPAGAADVTKRKLSVTIGEGPTQVVELDGSATSHLLAVERDLPVSLQLTDVDGSGNESQPSPVLAFTSRDTVPPPAPGELAVTGVSQTD